MGSFTTFLTIPDFSAGIKDQQQIFNIYANECLICLLICCIYVMWNNNDLITSSNMDSSERNERKFIKYALKLICNYSDSSYIILTRGLRVSGIVSTCCSPTKADKERGKHTEKNSEDGLPQMWSNSFYWLIVDYGSKELCGNALWDSGIKPISCLTVTTYKLCS